MAWQPAGIGWPAAARNVGDVVGEVDLVRVVVERGDDSLDPFGQLGVPYPESALGQ
jgi:hypothetical protein